MHACINSIAFTVKTDKMEREVRPKKGSLIMLRRKNKTNRRRTEREEDRDLLTGDEIRKSPKIEMKLRQKCIDEK